MGKSPLTNDFDQEIRVYSGALVPAVPSSIIAPVWQQFEALITPVRDEYLLGCRRQRLSDRLVPDNLVQVLVLGAAYERTADTTCSVTTLRTGHHEWISVGIFACLEDLWLETGKEIVGLERGDIVIDECVVKPIG